MVNPNPGITLDVTGYTYSNYSLHFNSDGVPSPYNGGTMCLMTAPLKPEQFTVSIWFKKDSYSFSPLQKEQVLFDNRGNNGIVGQWGIRIGISANGRIRAMLNSDLLMSPSLPWNVSTNRHLIYEIGSEFKSLDNTIPSRPYYDTTGPGGDGWFNIVVTMDGRYLKLYINGELDRSNSYVATNQLNSGGVKLENGVCDMLVDGQSVHYPTHPAYTNHKGAIGGHITGSGPAAGFDGVIDEVAVWDTGLDNETIKNLYNNGEHKWDLNTAFYKDNLISWWRFEDGNGSVVKDHSPSGDDLDIITRINGGVPWAPALTNWSTVVPPTVPTPLGQVVDIMILKVVPGQEASLTLEETIVR